jgi:hypothetical protein
LTVLFLEKLVHIFLVFDRHENLTLKVARQTILPLKFLKWMAVPKPKGLT